MTMIRKLNSAWMLIFITSLILPLLGTAAVSGTMSNTPFATTSSTVAKKLTAVTAIQYRRASLQSMAGDPAQTLLALSHDFPVTKRGTETIQRAMSRGELEAIQNSGVLSRKKLGSGLSL